MHPSQWMTSGTPIQLTKKENLEHVVSCFHFLLEKPGCKVQKYTAGELADAICRAYDIVKGDPRIAWAVRFLRSLDDGRVVIEVRNYWGV